MSSNVRLEAVIPAYESGGGRHRHVRLEPMRPHAPYDENEADQRLSRKSSKPPPTAPRPKLGRASSLGRHHTHDGDTTFAGYRPKDNLYNKTISWLKNLKPWNKQGNTSAASHNSISSTAETNGDGRNSHNKDSLYFINSGTGSLSNLHNHHYYQPHNHHFYYRKSSSLKGSRLASSISDRNLSSHLPRHDDDATTTGHEADPVLDPSVAVHYPHVHKTGSVRTRPHSQNRYSTSFCPDLDHCVDPYMDSSGSHFRDYSDPYDAYDSRCGYLNSQSCHGALPGGPQEYKTAGGQDYNYKQTSQDYRSRLRSGRASQENVNVPAHFSHYDPLPHHHYQPTQHQHYVHHQPSHSSNGHHHHHYQNASDRTNGDRSVHHHHLYHQNQQQLHQHHHYNHDHHQPQQQKQKTSAGRQGSSEELSVPQAAAVVSGNNVTRILRQKLFGRAKSSVNLHTDPGRHQARHGGGGAPAHLVRGMSSSHSAHSVSSTGQDNVVKLRAKKSKGLMSSSEHVYVVNREEKMLRPRSCAAIPQDGKLGVVHENPRVSAEGVEHDDVRRLAADERYDAVSPVTVRLRNKQRRLSEVRASHYYHHRSMSCLFCGLFQ
ncbi:hypothetical protein ElyMa_001861100 [Elysia marginata]|uniref:Uncharacterized protein n=1 Tax=Elysia marginata TaxID=1093978 RepID=A0AAV4ENJ4_9GAST|nr:hypothetical protein ElyMa_001861100 [Elysia marginata]